MPTHRSATAASPRVPAAPLAPPRLSPLAVRQRPRPLSVEATPYSPNLALHWPGLLRPHLAIGSIKCHAFPRPRPLPPRMRRRGHVTSQPSLPLPLAAPQVLTGRRRGQGEGRGRAISRDVGGPRPFPAVRGPVLLPARGRALPAMTALSGPPGALYGPRPNRGPPHSAVGRSAAPSPPSGGGAALPPHRGRSWHLPALQQGAGVSPRPLRSFLRPLSAFRSAFPLDTGVRRCRAPKTLLPHRNPPKTPYPCAGSSWDYNSRRSSRRCSRAQAQLLPPHLAAAMATAGAPLRSAHAHQRRAAAERAARGHCEVLIGSNVQAPPSCSR